MEGLPHLPSSAQEDATGLWLWLSWWDGFWKEACPLKSQSESKAFQKRVFLLYLVFLGYLVFQSSLQPIQGQGAEVEVIHANQHEWRGCKGWCRDCQEHLSNVQSLWICEVVGQVISYHQKPCFSFKHGCLVLHSCAQLRHWCMPPKKIRAKLVRTWSLL